MSGPRLRLLTFTPKAPSPPLSADLTRLVSKLEVANAFYGDNWPMVLSMLENLLDRLVHEPGAS